MRGPLRPPALALVALLALPPALGATPALEGFADCLGPLEGDAVLGPACRVLGGWRVFLRDGSSFTTHGPDPVRSFHGSPATVAATPSPPACVSDPATQYHTYAIYARATDLPDNYAARVPPFRAALNESNGRLAEEAAESGVTMNYKFRCAGGLVQVANAVLPTPSGSATFATIIDDLQDLGYNSALAHYLVYYDATYGGVSGLAQMYFDDSAGTSNPNNAGPLYAVSFQTFSSTVLMHEHAHTMGAVQQSAPHSTGYNSMTGAGGHCTDDLDVMCYNDSGPNSGSYTATACTDREHFDCAHDDYFHPCPGSGSYLATHWNLGAAVNRFLERTACPPPPPAACGDGLDNDEDGLVDYPADPGCASLADTDEANGSGAPGAPQTLQAQKSLRVQGTTYSGIKLTWAAPADTGGSAISAYYVYRGTTASNIAFYAVSAGAATNWQDPSTSPLAAYRYYVRAMNGAGEGPASNTVCSAPFPWLTSQPPGTSCA